jgi:glucan phosphoethanolaminetransferase (alkaline phosphatase superfamily)
MAGAREILLNISHFLVVLAGIFVLNYLVSLSRYLFAVVFPVLVLALAFISFFVYSQNLTLTTSVIDAALHNDMRTSADLFTWPLFLFVFASLFVALLAVWYRFKKVSFRWRWFEVLIILILAAGVYGINHIRFNTVVQRLPFSLYHVGKQYFLQQEDVSKRRISVGTDAVTDSDSLTVILVIGEAYRADHASLNRYFRPTNRLLAKQNVVSYGNIYSEWTHTNSSLPHILTRSDSVNHRPAKQEQSFISIFNRCGFSSFWITNQEPAPSYISFVKEAQTLWYVNPANSVYLFNRKWLDTDNLKYLRTGLENENKRKLIVIHTIGSHWWYNDHFTDDLAVFKPILDSKVLSASKKEQIINSYDNTLVYTDYFLNEVIRSIKPLNSCMIYLSDHGESLGENDMWLHAQDNGPEHYPACFFWFSEKYIRNYPSVYKSIVQNKDKRWRTEFLFPSILSIGRIKTASQNKACDITR